MGQPGKYGIKHLIVLDPSKQPLGIKVHLRARNMVNLGVAACWAQYFLQRLRYLTDNAEHDGP
jgi:hypothetical protein